MSGRRKVRWPHLSGCGHYLVSGQEILGADDIWRCKECATLARLMTEAPRPGRGGQDEPATDTKGTP